MEDEFPEFVGQARTTVRLHPRSGRPGPHDSSLGGPLLWPAAEPWPVCESPDHDEAGEPVPTTVAVLQVYARDVPELPFPDGTDVLQVLWCPGLHDDGCWPLPTVRWRTASSITGPLLDAPVVDPEAEEVNEEYVPQPCTLTPERVSEYPDGWELDDDLRERVMSWAGSQGWDYFHHLGAAPGTKAGGWPNWIQDPWYPECDTCGTPMSHLLTIASWEFDGESIRRWVPVDDSSPGAFARPNDAGLSLADAGSFYLLVCESCPDRPVKDVSQSS